MKIDLKKSFVLLFYLLYIVDLQSQTYKFKDFNTINFEVDRYYLFTLNDNENILGQFVEKNGETITITSTTRSTLNLYDVKKIRVVNSNYIAFDNYWFPNPLSNRYFYNPSAFTSGHLKGYIQNIYVFLFNATLGLSDYVDINVGADILDSDNRTASVRVGNIKVASNLYAGGSFTYLKGYYNSNILGFGLLTYGNRNNNVTFGAGLINKSETTTPNKSFQLNGMYRVTQKFSLISENILSLNSNGFFYHGLGLRFFNQTWSLDAGALLDSQELPDEILVYFSGSFKF